MINRFFNRRVLVTLATMLIVVVSLSSCETLKKKFTRKKKASQNESAEFQPVLEPQDYPEPAQDPVRNYQQHYRMVKAWYRDLWTAIDDRSSGPHVKYTLKQIYSHMEEMAKLVDPAKQQELQKLKDLLAYYAGSLESSWQARNVSRIQSDLRAFDRQLRRELRPDKVKNHFVSAVASSGSAA